MTPLYTLLPRRTTRHFVRSFQNPLHHLAKALVLLLLFGNAEKGKAQTGSCLTPSFSLKGAYPTQENQPKGLAAGDLNGDGISDVVVVNGLTEQDHYHFDVLLNDGSGALGTPVSYPTGIEIFAATIADLNGDGKADIAVSGLPNSAASDYKTIAIFYNNGNGTFTAGEKYSSIFFAANFITAADLNGDGKPDLAVSDYNSKTVTVLLNSGSGTFANPVAYPSGGDGPFSIAVADINGDAKPDLLVANYLSGTINTLLNTGTGAFIPGASFASGGAQPFSITTSDFNNDGKADIAAANRDSDNASVLLGKGDGTFQSPKLYPSGGSFPQSVTTADYNGDGKPDLAVANLYSSNVALLLGKGDGTFQPAVTFQAGAYPGHVVTGKLNGDNKPDLAVINDANNSTVTVLLNDCNRDSDGDGVPDAYDCEPNNKKVAKYLVCHKGKTLCIGKDGVQDHVGHGDKLGTCGTPTKSTSEAGSLTVEESERAAGVYPNPTSGVFILQLNNARAEAAQVVVVDAKGASLEQRRVVLTQGRQTLRFNLSGKAAGLYLVQVRTESGVGTFKVFLQH